MRNERGVALVLAILVLTVIGALVAAAFFAGTQEHRMAEQVRRVQRALGAAEAGLAEVMRQWPDDATNLGLYPTDSLALAPSTTPFGTGEFEGYVYRLGSEHFLVTVTGRDLADRARQRLGLLLRRAAACDTTVADGVELSPPNCYISNTFPKTSDVMPLPARAWIQLF